MDKQAYIVQPGHAVYAGRKTHREGAIVHLGARDGARLTAQGAVAPAEGAGVVETPAVDLGDAAKPQGTKPVNDGEPGILDGNTAQVTAALAGLDLEALQALRAQELAGKTRKGVIAAIDAAIEAATKPAGDGEE